jgi:hypothetical protein
LGWGQKPYQNKHSVDAAYFQGSILLHNTDISHLITKHPSGFIGSFNWKTEGQKEWQRVYNYPDYGLTFAYHRSHNITLGDVYGLYGHYNFYFFNRNLQFKVGQGIGYATNPFDKVGNFRNVAYGSDITASTLLQLQYHKPRLWGRLGVKAGMSVLHFSNASFKAPNTSTNTLGWSIGLEYDLQDDELEYIPRGERLPYSEPIAFNLSLRFGVNESDVVGSGQYGFWEISANADKRVSRVSALQFGADVFFSHFLKELIYYQSVSFPEKDVTGDEDYKRVGLYIGHELFINRLSILAQIGYYVYYPFDFEGRVYNRIGLKYYWNDRFFNALTLKSHSANAESVALGIGVRL